MTPWHGFRASVERISPSVRRASPGAVAALGLVVVAAACGGAERVSTSAVTQTVTVAEPGAGEASPRQVAEFGYIKSLKARDDGFEMRFDPAWFLSGVTANTAAAEDGAVEPGEPVPNDDYVVNEGDRELTYVVPGDARVTVLTRAPEGSEISVAELAQLVAGGNPLGQPLFEPITTGFWIVVEIDTVRSLEQQYLP